MDLVAVTTGPRSAPGCAVLLDLPHCRPTATMATRASPRSSTGAKGARTNETRDYFTPNETRSTDHPILANDGHVRAAPISSNVPRSAKTRSSANPRCSTFVGFSDSWPDSKNPGNDETPWHARGSTGGRWRD